MLLFSLALGCAQPMPADTGDTGPAASTPTGDTAPTVPAWSCPWEGSWALESATCGSFPYDYEATATVASDTEAEACVWTVEHPAVPDPATDGATTCVVVETWLLGQTLGVWELGTDGGVGCAETSAELVGLTLTDEPPDRVTLVLTKVGDHPPSTCTLSTRGYTWARVP